jgi:FlaA1/EpsC-like NDP-sugar epimerase
MSDSNHPSFLNSVLLRAAGARVFILFIFHLIVFAACYAFSCLIRFEFHIPPEAIPDIKASFPYVLAIEIVVATMFGFFRGWWRYVGIQDVIRMFAGNTSSLVILMLLWYQGDLVGFPHLGVSRGALLINWAFVMLALFGARVLIRIGRDFTRDETSSGGPSIKRVVIIGAGDAGEALARELQHRPQLGMKIVGFVDDHRAKWQSHIRGIEVRGPIEHIATIADELDATEALLAIPSASGKRIRDIVHHLIQADLQFKTIPGVDQLVSGKVHVTQLRPVNVEDLLRRARIELPGDPVRELFKGKRVLITGAGGTIGSELASQIFELQPAALHLVERSEYALYQSGRRLRKERVWDSRLLSEHLVDIRDTETIRQLIDEVRPHIVLHAAAHKHVPLGEQNPAEYLHNNCLATRRMAELCAESGVKRFVLISTDKAINPTSVMGAAKRAAEIALLDLARKSEMRVSIVRFGNVIGSSGSVIPLFLEQIQEGGPVTVTHPEVTRYFLRTSEAVSLVLQAATLGTGGEVFMLDMGEPVKIVDLARDLIRLSNHTEDEIPIVFTGMRPGEKLFEELRLEGESISPTVHPQIVITQAPQPEKKVVDGWLARAHRVSAAGSAVTLLKELIPEYVNSDRSDEDDPQEPLSRAKAPLLTESRA